MIIYFKGKEYDLDKEVIVDDDNDNDDNIEYLIRNELINDEIYAWNENGYYKKISKEETMKLYG